MAVTFRPLSPPTDEEMLALHSLNPGCRVERLPDGALFVSPNGTLGSVRNVELTFQLAAWQRARRLGLIAALTKDRREQIFRGAPNAAFEIVSKTDSPRQQRDKGAAYARNGSALVVVIDPSRRGYSVGLTARRSETRA